MVEPTEILARLQAARKAFEQRDFELAITNCDYIIANAEGSSEEAKEAKELRRHASEHELLSKIAEASVFNAAIPLIEQAIQKKKLRYDLDGKPLQAALDTWASQRSAEADAQARTLLEEGQRLEDQKEYAAAQTSYQGATGIAFTSEVIQQNAAAGQKRVQDILLRWQDYQDLVKQAGDLQARGDFLAAQTAASQAVRSFPENPGEAEVLVRQLEEQVKEAERMDGLLDGAEKDLGSKDFDQAAASFGTALEIARRLNLPERVQEIEARLAEVQRQRQEMGDQVKGLAQKARAAVEQGKLAEAASLLGKLRELDPFNLELSEVQALMQRREDVLEAVKKIKDDAAATSKSPREQLRLYEQALVLLPGDPELLELKAQANKALINEAIAATEAELDLGFDTPGELEQGKLAPDGRVLVKGIQQWIEEYGTAAASDLVTLSHQVFGRIAAQKLREFIATRAGEKQRKGKLAEAVVVYDQALKEWQVDWLLTSSVEWLSSDGQTLKSPLVRKALKSRLEIVKKQRQLVMQTQENYPPIDGFKQSGDAALNQHHYDTARQRYEDALREIIALEAGQQAVLSGVRAELTRTLARSLRLTAQELSADIQTQRRQTEQHRDLNELEAALRKAGEAKNNAHKLGELYQRFQEITPKEQQAAWAASDQSADIDALYTQVESYLRYYQAFKQGDVALEDGEYGAAEQYYKLVEPSSPWGAEARGRLDKLPVLQQLRAEYENAKDRKDYQAAIDTLGKVISQDGHSTWVAAERVHLAPLAEKQRRAALLVSLAETAMQARNYPLAVGQLEEALQDFPGDKAAETLLATARQKQVESEQVAQARKQMIEEYQRGAERRDYESALARANQVLLDNPEDETAKRVLKTSKEIIDLSREIEDKEALRDYAGAQALLEAKSYLSGDYINNLQFRISQKLEEKSRFEDLLAQAKAASEQKDWGTVLGKASLAAQKSPSSAEPRNLATQARNHLVQLIKEKVDPRAPVTAEALGAAENAVAAIRMAQGEEALNEILGDLVNPLNRARAIIKARSHLASNEPGAAYEALKPFEGQRSTDAELEVILREAEFAAKRKQALDILGSRPIDYAAAAKLLNDALLINPQDLEVSARYKEARLEAGLKACNDALRQGQATHLARQHLLGLPHNEPRVADMQNALDALDRTMGEAQGFFNNIQHEKAIQALDEALKVWAGYGPAEAQRQAILEDALDRAEKADVAEDYDLARAYYRLGREFGFEETRKRGRDGVQAIDEKLDSMFLTIYNEVNEALEDPDLTENRRAELQSAFSQLAVRNADRQDRKEIINSCVVELKDRSELIRQVEKHLDDAEKELANALAAPTYEMASERFTHVERTLEKATSVEHYSRRSRTRKLRDDLTEHLRKRKEANDAYRSLTSATNALYRPLDTPLSAISVIPDEVEAVQTAGESLLDTALQANRRAKELDPLNKYLVRAWQTQDDPQSDPLLQQENHLLKQQAELKKLGNAMITALRKRIQAKEQDRSAQDLRDRAADDDTIKDAITTWGKAVKNYQEAHQLLKNAAVELPPNSIPHLQGLRNLCAFLIKSCEDAEDDVTRRSQEVVKVLDEISWKRKSAIQAFDEREQDRKARVTALDLYQEILELNPRDSESLSRTRVLNKEIRDIKNGQRTALLGGGIALLVLVLALVAFAIFRPGGVGNPYTPTPTASPTGTRTPTLTATITLTPTVTPSPVLPPTRTPTATIGPTLTPTQWLCRVTQLTYAYTDPSTSNSAVTRFDTGMFVHVSDLVPPQITADNRWWIEIFYDTLNNPDVPDLLYIQAFNVPVECWSMIP